MLSLPLERTSHFTINLYFSHSLDLYSPCHVSTISLPNLNTHLAADLFCSRITSHASIGEHHSIIITQNTDSHIPSYNLRYNDLSVVNIAFHRAVAVIIGVLWAFIVSQFWWPAEARRELGKALGEYVSAFS